MIVYLIQKLFESLIKSNFLFQFNSLFDFDKTYLQSILILENRSGGGA